MKMTKKVNKSRITSALCVLCSALLLSCSSDEGFEQEGLPEVPTVGYRWTFGGGVGTDDGAASGQQGTATRAGHWVEENENGLTFAWDYGTTNEMVFAVFNTDYNEFLGTIGQYDFHTYMFVEEHPTKDDHKAIFESVSTFYTPQSELADHIVYAVTPIITGEDGNESSVQSSVGDFRAELSLPDRFEQRENANPEFLHKYMYMSAQATLNENGNVEGGLHFRHIPATLRFKVENRSDMIGLTIGRIAVSTTKPQGIAPRHCILEVTEDGGFEPEYREFYYSTVYVENRDNMTPIRYGEHYTGYMLLFPGVDFEDTDNITITVEILNKEEYTERSLSITGKQLNAVTGSSMFLSGNLYTFNLRYEVQHLSLTGITVTDWTDGGTIPGTTTEVETQAVMAE